MLLQLYNSLLHTVQRALHDALAHNEENIMDNAHTNIFQTKRGPQKTSKESSGDCSVVWDGGLVNMHTSAEP